MQNNFLKGKSLIFSVLAGLVLTEILKGSKELLLYLKIIGSLKNNNFGEDFLIGVVFIVFLINLLRQLFGVALAYTSDDFFPKHQSHIQLALFFSSYYIVIVPFEFILKIIPAVHDIKHVNIDPSLIFLFYFFVILGYSLWDFLSIDDDYKIEARIVDFLPFCGYDENQLESICKKKSPDEISPILEFKWTREYFANLVERVLYHRTIKPKFNLKLYDTSKFVNNKQLLEIIFTMNWLKINIMQFILFILYYFLVDINSPNVLHLVFIILLTGMYCFLDLFYNSEFYFKKN